MKTITFLKALTIGMSLLILAGLVAVALKITDLRMKSKPLPIQSSEVTLVFPESIRDVLPCGEMLCVLTIGHESGRRLFVVNPDKGRAESIITFKETL